MGHGRHSFVVLFVVLLVILLPYTFFVQQIESQRNGIYTLAVLAPQSRIEREDLHSKSPILNLAFLHMRKSGGTHINKIVTEFMYEHSCITANEKVSVRGIKDGVPLDMLTKKDFKDYYSINNSAHCPKVNMIHEEMLSLDGKALLKFPPRGERNDKSFSLLTTLRHPIERIGSQAFYGKYSIARTVIIDIIEHSSNVNCTHYQKRFEKNKNAFNPVSEAEFCSKNSPEKRTSLSNKICNCLESSVIQSREVIRTNESVWFYWIKNVVGYHDQYLSNYFIKRLVMRTKDLPFDKNNCSNFLKASKCIEENGCQNASQYQLLEGIFRLEPGTGFLDQNQRPVVDLDYDITAALNISKQLLRYQFDFVIMEYFDQPRTLSSLRQALHSSLLPPKSFIGNTDNKGLFNPIGYNSTNSNKGTSQFRHLLDDQTATILLNRKLSSSSYRSNMPASVVTYLEKDNAEDIELYNFALEEFEERSKKENWELL